GEVELDREVQRPIARNVIHPIANPQHVGAWLEHHLLGDPKRHAVSLAIAVEDDARGVSFAADFVVVRPLDEVAALRLAAGADVMELQCRLVEMVDQALAAVGVVLKQAFEPGLLEDDLLVSAGSSMMPGMALDRLVIDLGPARERG